MGSAASWSETAAPTGSQGTVAVSRLGAWISVVQRMYRGDKGREISSQIRCFWECGICQQRGADCANPRASPDLSSGAHPLQGPKTFLQEDAN